MPEYLSPGVYVEEVSSGAKPIEGVGTSTAGFVGATERGPEGARLISSFLDFERWYGGHIDDSYLAFAVQGFFENGGQRCFVARVVKGGDKAATAVAPVAASAKIGNLQLAAVGRGKWGDQITFQVLPSTQNAANWFRLRITFPGLEPEDFDNLTPAVGAANSAVTTINSASRLVRAWWEGTPERPDPTLAAVKGVKGDKGDKNSGGKAAEKSAEAGDNGGGTPAEKYAWVPLKGGKEGVKLTVADFEGKLEKIPVPGSPPDGDLLGRGRGLAALAAIDEVAILAAPDEVRDGLDVVTGKVINQCELLKDRFALVSVTRGQSDVGALRPPQDSAYAGFYYPWIEVFDPRANSPRLVPPSGHVAGIFARTDVERGVHKAPANSVVRGASNLEFPITKAMHDMLNPRGINVIRDFRGDGRGIRLWGARTMSSDPEWRYINVRRLFIFVEESIDQGTQWVVFEPNDPGTWGSVVRNVTGFLSSLWRSGALIGNTADEAFFVRCDRTTMTQDDIDNGRLICLIGIAPVKPAEFVIFRISQKIQETA